MSALSRDELLSAGLADRAQVPVPGGHVVIRAVTRAQALAIRAAGREPDRQEPLILHYGLAEPELSVQDAEKWLAQASAGVIQQVVLAIAELSGMDEHAGKERTKSPARKR